MNQFSPGQRLALDQLRRIASASRNALTIGHYDDAPDRFGRLVVELALELPPELAGSGIVGREEHVLVGIPADYPFEEPAVEACHDRFAGLPHVQWRKSICLYQSAADWDAAEGMMGFVTRLSTWYRRAARGALELPGQPLHPPVAYVTGWTGCVVIHENAPRPDVLTGDPWRGYAVVSRGSDRRADVRGWLAAHEQECRSYAALSGWLDGQEERLRRPVSLAAAVLLPGQMTFEFPRYAGELVDAIADQGMTAGEVVDLLGTVAWLNQARTRSGDPAAATEPFPPLYALIGAPMRGLAGSRDRLIHLAAWRLTDYEAQLAPALVRLWDAQNPDEEEQTRQVTDEVNHWLDTAKTSWATVYEQRAEIVERRDSERPAQWLRGKRILILGCGALGAPIAEQVLRAGAGELILADNGRVNPGVLVRQPYEDADIGRLKTEALATRLLYISPDTAVIVNTGNVLDTVLGSDAPPDADLVIDATASQTVAAKLERCRWTSHAEWPTILTVAIGHLAERGIAALALPGASGAGADILRRLALAVPSTAGLADVAADFFPHPPRTKIFQPEPGCSAPTFRGSASEVQALAAQLLAGALHDLSVADERPDVRASAPMSARIARLPYATGTVAGMPARDRVTWVSDWTIDDAESGYQVRFAQAALDSMQDEVHGTSKSFGPDVETGGMLMGQIDDPSRVIWVTSATGPAPDSRQSSSYVSLGTDGAQEILTAIQRASKGRNRFIGMWHSHPRTPPYESETDHQAINGLLADPDHPQHRVLLVILGGGPAEWDAWVEGGGTPEFYIRFASRLPDPDSPGVRASATG